ncbi:MAG: DUF5916 domain-containing protein [Saprospiraceae bacterium]
MKRIIPIQIITLLFLSTFCYGEEGFPVQKISTNFTFDGVFSAGEWDNIEPVQLTVQTPNYQGKPSERTEIRMAYDANYIYLSGAMYDSEAHKIMANNKLRDGGDASTEWFGMVIDSYNDKQNALGFFTTPTGSRFDAAISNDGNGRNPMNVSWNNFWDVKTVVNEEGWFAEMRIPFSSLQFQTVDGKVTMGITMWRYIARKNEMHISPDISPDLGEMGTWRPSQAKTYIFENVEQKKPFYITPYVLGGRSTVQNLNTAGTAYEADNTFVKDIGLDVKYGISNNFTLDLTVNTDFAQVEADDQQVNLTRFSLFFPEKRLFFQERSGIFDFTVGSRNNLFYSRRIGIDSDGKAIPILGGARLTGRTGNWDIGLISMQTKSTDAFASNNYSVFRVKRRIINENSDAGFLLTNNIDVDGNNNTVYGFDTNIRIAKNQFLSAKFAQSFSSDVETTTLSADPSVFWLSLSKRSQRGFVYGTSISRLGKDFDARVGFLERSNYVRFGSRLGYNWFPDVQSTLLRHGPTVRGVSYWENTNNTYNSAFYGVGYEWVWRNGSVLEVGTRLQYDDITDAFSLADIVEIPIDDYFYQSYQVEYATPTGKPYQLAGEVQTGDFYDGKKTTIQLAPNYNINSSLNLSATYEWNKVNFASRNQSFIAHVGRLKAQVMFSTKFSISSFVQYNSLDKLYLGNIRLRYNPKEGNDLFIVYNSDLNAERGLENPLLPLSNQSSLLIKYSYTFSL